MSIVGEIREYWRFKKKTPASDKEIIFYAEHEGYFPYFEGVINELVNKYGKTVSYITSDINDPILGEPAPGIRTFYINKLLALFMAFVECRVFIMTLTDLNQFHLKRSSNPVHYIYMFHALVSTHMMYRYGAFDHYDSILCVGPHQLKEIRKFEEMNNLPPRKLIEAGYYRLERIYKAYKAYSSLKNSSCSEKTILIAPSWGKDNVLESCGERLVKLLLGAGHNVIIRPHPETVRRSPQLIKNFKKLFDDNSRFTLELSVRTDDSLLEADVLICDCSGVALEYALGTERPVIFLDVPVKIKNQRYKELGMEPLELTLRSKIGVLVSPEKLEEIPRVISVLIAEREKYRLRLQELRDKYVYNFGSSSEVGARFILELLGD